VEGMQKLCGFLKDKLDRAGHLTEGSWSLHGTMWKKGGKKSGPE